MKVRSLIILMVGVGVCLLGTQCASSKKKELTAKEYYQIASKYLARKEYLKATESFQALISNYPGSEWVDDGQYGLAESYFCSLDYVNALFEYKRIVDDFSMSPLVEKAQFKIAMCYFKQSLDAVRDQENTLQAAQAFVAFLEEYPDSPLAKEAQEKYAASRTKLAEKEYRNGELYLKMGQYEAALLYFGEVLDTFGDTLWVPHARYGIGCALLKQGEREGARQAFGQVVGSGTDERLIKKAKKKLKEMEKGG
ncbi:MAG: outer membrane protein assembly factor BamD [Candidatus Latescibacterota bacterium]